MPAVGSLAQWPSCVPRRWLVGLLGALVSYLFACVCYRVVVLGLWNYVSRLGFPFVRLRFFAHLIMLRVVWYLFLFVSIKCAMCNSSNTIVTFKYISDSGAE